MKKIIMIVEDNVILSDMYRFKLELEQFQVIVKSNGLAAITKLSDMEPEPDLVLLDLMMPGMNGFEVLETVKACDKLKHSKIIVFSNLNEPKDRQRCLDLGADEFILKSSVTPKELVEKIRNVLEK
jgi:DNA-binding response OmpR family regulator